MTRVFGVLGHPVARSLSPRLHAAWIGEAGLDAAYHAFDVGPPDPGTAARAIEAARTLGLAGFNLTVPLKESAIPHLDALDSLAQAIGAVNTVVVRDGVLIGQNTDADGLCDAVEAAGRPVDRVRAVVLGAGGAGRAVAAGLARRGAASVCLLNRDPERAVRAADHLRANGIDVDAGGLDLAASALARAHLVVCAGARGASYTGVDPHLARNHPLWIDLNYGGPLAPVVEAARAQGHQVLDGLGMLIHQGARAFTAFTGAPADPAAGWRAARSGEGR